MVNAAEMNTPLPEILPFRHPGLGPWLLETSSSPPTPCHAGERGVGSAVATLPPGTGVLSTAGAARRPSSKPLPREGNHSLLFVLKTRLAPREM